MLLCSTRNKAIVDGKVLKKGRFHVYFCLLEFMLYLLLMVLWRRCSVYNTRAVVRVLDLTTSPSAIELFPIKLPMEKKPEDKK